MKNNSRRLTTPLLILCLALGACDFELDDLVQRKEAAPGDFLSDANYTSLLVEVVCVEGFRPTSAALTNIEEMLKARLNKPDGITTSVREIASPGFIVYTADRLKELEKKHREERAQGNVLTAFVFFADKPYSEGPRVLGLTYDHSSMAVFQQTVRDGSGGIGQPGGVAMETYVMAHEFGHVLGLVNRGTPMLTDHEDPSSKSHCISEKCVMAAEGQTRITAASIEFDVNCLEDLKANGGL